MLLKELRDTVDFHAQVRFLAEIHVCVSACGSTGNQMRSQSDYYVNGLCPQSDLNVQKKNVD